jgi:hypothetical protein
MTLSDVCAIIDSSGNTKTDFRVRRCQTFSKNSMITAAYICNLLHLLNIPRIYDEIKEFAGHSPFNKQGQAFCMKLQ